MKASNFDEAKAELERKRTERHDGKLPQVGHRPMFDEFALEYLEGPILAQKKKALNRTSGRSSPVGRPIWAGRAWTKSPLPSEPREEMKKL